MELVEPKLSFFMVGQLDVQLWVRVPVVDRVGQHDLLHGALGQGRLDVVAVVRPEELQVVDAEAAINVLLVDDMARILA
jgi:hypothetical protein